MNDTIYREDAIKAVSISCGTCLARDTEDCEKCSVPKLRELINAIPTADRPQGEWELSAFQNEEEVANGNYTFICSNCEHSDIHALTQTVPYCWWCGARMVAKDINVPSKKGADDE